VDGSLEHRFAGTKAANNLRAKTGTLTHAYALSGYVTDARGEHLAFSLMLNHYQRPTDTLGRNTPPSPTADLDAIATMIAGQ
jgi:D-alanyl-D-alanine carboxypeptidase/D-alanyl-D-alanine-endopeptidase (penicillin-binding protein 4)